MALALRNLLLGLLLAGWLTGCLIGCSQGAGQRSDSSRGGAGSGSGGFDNPTAGSGGASGVGNPTGGMGGRMSGPPGPGCGNGERSSSEACDDGNTTDGDGCARDCLAIEPGYACQRAGEACRRIAKCGDGVLAPSEACEDGNATAGDGCSERCKIELGFKCDVPAAPCEPTTCGDGNREGAEGCDDGNAIAFDGCSARCEAEPDCSGGACSSRCGDGLVIDEACDDGNGKDGDGCSAQCQLEDGFMCERDKPCEMRGGACVLRVPVVFRDFAESHPDFGIGCGQMVLGAVEAQLDAERKPVLADGSQVCIESQATFSQWYRATDALTPSELLLYENGSGGFVNRFGPDGEQFAGRETFTNLTYGGPVGGGCPMCTPSAAGQCFDPCTPWNDMNQACCGERMQQMFDGNPLFFPVDGVTNAADDVRAPAKIPEEYGHDGWPFEDTVFPGAGAHNFFFTTEVAYWFAYDPSRAAVLEFSGDDDVWVYVNGRLAVDLGGPHVPEFGSVTIDGAAAATFGLSEGAVYEIRVFHAERKVDGSSFKLTLSGFDAQPSDCTPICGDGVVTAGEQCDDGMNDGGYEECFPGCVLGDSCGDGIVQADEDCDDGNRIDGDGCGSSCRILTVD